MGTAIIDTGLVEAAIFGSYETAIQKIDESQDIVVLKSKVRPQIHPLWLLSCSPILMEAKSVWMI